MALEYRQFGIPALVIDIVFALVVLLAVVVRRTMLVARRNLKVSRSIHFSAQSPFCLEMNSRSLDQTWSGSPWVNW
jgi:hypothetical protein